MSFGGGGRWGRGGVFGLLSLVFRVLVCSGPRGYGAWWHGVVGPLRFRRLLLGLLARGRCCQWVSDGQEKVVVVVPAVGWSALPVGGSGGGVWLRCCRALYDRVGDACGWWRARSAVPFSVSSEPWGVVVILVVRVVRVLEWVMVPLAVPLVRAL